MTDFSPEALAQLHHATSAHQLGQFALAEQRYREFITEHPGNADARLRLISVLLRQRRPADAADAARGLLRLVPGHLHGLYYLGAALAMQALWEEAEAAYRQLVLLQPGHALAQNDLGNVLTESGRHRDAADAYRKALAIDAGFHQAAVNLAGALLRQDEVEQAIAYLQGVLKVQPDHARAHALLGDSFAGQGVSDEALISYRRALALDPSQADAQTGLGLSLLRLGHNDDALAAFRQAGRLLPGAVSKNNEANALKALGRLDEAETLYRQVLLLEPSFMPAAHNLGMVLCERGQIAEGFAFFTRASETVTARSAAPNYKLAHDREQQDWLGQQGLPPQGLGAAPRLAAAVNPALESEQMAERWLRASPQVIVVDNLLTPQALESLHRFCLQSTMWGAEHEEGYLGAMPEHGFAPPLLAQIAEELPRRLPGIFGGQRLLHHWAFKYDSTLDGIKVHADFAAVNVNFWITPDDANLDPQSGGLLVWDVGAPLDWTFERYNCSEGEIRNLLRQRGARAMRVPYKANRAVIFDSDLFHETDTIRFRPGYANRRINVTLLYGNRADASNQEGISHVI